MTQRECNNCDNRIGAKALNCQVCGFATMLGHRVIRDGLELADFRERAQFAAVQMALLLLESLRTSWEYMRGYRDGLSELREGMHALFGGSLEREP